MKKLSVLIVEGENATGTTIHDLIVQKFAQEAKVGALVSNLKDMYTFLKKSTFDLILLDTDVSHENVFEFLRPHMELLKNVEFIVVSSSTGFAMESFEFAAIDYILKPIEYNDMVLAFTRAKVKLGVRDFGPNQRKNYYTMNNSPVKIVAIPSLTEVKILPVETIIYLQSEGKYTIFHTIDNKTVVSSRNLGVYEKLLSNNNFFRIHHSYIVNVDLACNIYKKDGTYLEIFNKKYLPISKRKAESFYKFLGI